MMKMIIIKVLVETYLGRTLLKKGYIILINGCRIGTRKHTTTIADLQGRTRVSARHVTRRLSGAHMGAPLLLYSDLLCVVYICRGGVPPPEDTYNIQTGGEKVAPHKEVSTH